MIEARPVRPLNDVILFRRPREPHLAANQVAENEIPLARHLQTHDALPTLRAHALPAVLFVPVHFIGREAALEPSTLPAPVCTLNDLRYLEGQGVSVQSLGVTGRSFDELSETEREWEAMRSRQALEAALQVPIELFAFPRGDPGPEPVATGRMILRCGYRAAFACRGSANRLRDADRFRLARVTVGPNTDLSTALGERATRLA